MVEKFTKIKKTLELGELEEIQMRIDNDLPTMRGRLSDGDHTFDELYYHRMILFATICRQNRDKAWKARYHADGSMYPDYFIVGIKTPKGQFTYHYQAKFWETFAGIPTLDRAPEWDGHQPDDVIRLLSLLD